MDDFALCFFIYYVFHDAFHSTGRSVMISSVAMQSVHEQSFLIPACWSGSLLSTDSCRQLTMTRLRILLGTESREIPQYVILGNFSWIVSQCDPPPIVASFSPPRFSRRNCRACLLTGLNLLKGLPRKYCGGIWLCAAFWWLIAALISALVGLPHLICNGILATCNGILVVLPVLVRSGPLQNLLYRLYISKYYCKTNVYEMQLVLIGRFIKKNYNKKQSCLKPWCDYT